VQVLIVVAAPAAFAWLLPLFVHWTGGRVPLPAMARNWLLFAFGLAVFPVIAVKPSPQYGPAGETEPIDGPQALATPATQSSPRSD
jgi:hypothetical protein